MRIFLCISYAYIILKIYHFFKKKSWNAFKLFPLVSYVMSRDDAFSRRSRASAMTEINNKKSLLNLFESGITLAQKFV